MRKAHAKNCAAQAAGGRLHLLPGRMAGGRGPRRGIRTTREAGLDSQADAVHCLDTDWVGVEPLQHGASRDAAAVRQAMGGKGRCRSGLWRCRRPAPNSTGWQNGQRAAGQLRGRNMATLGRARIEEGAGCVRARATGAASGRAGIGAGAACRAVSAAAVPAARMGRSCRGGALSKQ